MMKKLKITLGDILVILGYSMLSVGLSLLNWKYALVIMGCITMYGGVLYFRKTL
jgi:uncharacterized membrane protein